MIVWGNFIMPLQKFKKIKFGIGFILTLIVLVLLFDIAPVQVSGQESHGSDTRSRQSFTHVVFAEDFTAEWCQYCPSASETLNEVYNAQYYDQYFYYVCMITQDNDSNVLNEDAQARADELGISSYPTVEFDGGYYEETGSQSDDSTYREAIETCGSRNVPQLAIDLSAQYNGDAEISIDVAVTYNDDGSYSGVLRVYIVEITSRYFDYDGNHYPFGFLDYALDTDVDLSSDKIFSRSMTWSGSSVTDGHGNDYSDITPENIVIYATIMNAENTPFRERIPQSSMSFNLNLIDQAAAFFLSSEPNPSIDNDPPEISIISPEENEEVAGSIRVQAEVTDDSAITKVEFKVDKGASNIVIWTNMLYSDVYDWFMMWQTIEYPDGYYTLTVRAFDSRNNIGEEWVDIYIKNDFEDPVVRFKDLEDGNTISDLITLRVIATDDVEVKNVRYQIDSGSWNSMKPRGFNEYTVDIDTTELSDGEHDFTVEAEDNSGKTFSDTITLKVKNHSTNAGSTDSDSSTPGFETLLLIVATFIVVTYLTRKKRKN